MKKYRDIINIAILVLFAFSFWWIRNTESVEKIDFRDSSQVLQLEVNNDSLQCVIEGLEVKLKESKAKEDSLLTYINNSKRNLNRLKKKKHEEVLLIDAYNDDELFEFFSGIDTESKTD